MKISILGWIGFGLLLTTILVAADSNVAISEEGGEDFGEEITSPSRDLDSATDYRTTAETLSDRIVKATVYSDRASITRRAEVTLPAGKHWVEFARLPENLDRGTLRVDVKGEAKLVQLVMEEVYEHVGLSPDVKKDLSELRSLYGKLLVLTQERGSLSSQLNFISSLSLEEPFKREPAAQINRGFRANIGNVKASLDEIKQQTISLTDRISKIDGKTRTVNESIDLLVSKLRKVTSQQEQKWVLHGYVLVDSSAKARVPIEITYMLPNAKWYPSYDIRAELNRESSTADLKLVTSAQLEQHTGEDWKASEITFSSLDPVPLFLPRLTRWTFEEQRVEQPQASAVMDEISSNEEGSARGGRPMEKAIAMDRRRDVAPKKEMAQVKPAPYAGNMKQKSALAPAAAPKSQNLNQIAGGAGAPADGVALSEPVAPELDDQTDKDSGRADMPALAGKLAKSSGTEYGLAQLEDRFPVLRELGNAMSALQTRRQFRPVDLRGAQPATFQKITHSDPELPAVQAKGRLIELKSPFKVDLSNDGSLKTPVDTLLAKGQLSYFTIPKMDNRVFLRAKMVNDTNRLLLAGAAQIFMDGDLITKSRLPTIDEGGEFTMDLGVDKNIETKRTVSKRAESKGIVSSSRVTNVDVKIEIANHHNFPVKMEVRDQYPLSPEERLKVELQKMTPEPREKDKEREDGLLSWEFTVPANEKKSILFTYKVTHPQNAIVSEFN